MGKMVIKVIGIGDIGFEVIETMIQKGMAQLHYIYIDIGKKKAKDSHAKTCVNYYGEKAPKSGYSSLTDLSKKLRQGEQQIRERIKGADMVILVSDEDQLNTPAIAKVVHKEDVMALGVISVYSLLQDIAKEENALLDRARKYFQAYFDAVIPVDNIIGFVEEEKIPLIISIIQKAVMHSHKAFFRKPQKSQLANIVNAIDTVLEVFEPVSFERKNIIQAKNGLPYFAFATADGKNRAEIAIKKALDAINLQDIKKDYDLLVQASSNSGLTEEEREQINNIMLASAIRFSFNYSKVYGKKEELHIAIIAIESRG
jgi:cell division GTPase FtsZ